MATLNVFRGGDGPALLLLHGIGSSGTAWRQQIDLLGSSFHCLAPDLPGYGDSPPASGPGLEAIASDVASVLQGVPAHVVGVSFGALTALALARFQPALVRSLVLSDATLGRASLPGPQRQRWLEERERLAQDLATRSLERAREIAAPGAAPAVLEEIASHMRRARPDGYVNVARTIAATDARPWLGGIAQPALVLCGEHDRVTGLDVSATLSRELPQATLVSIANAGHAPHLEQPGAFAGAVLHFLQQTGA